ncbi:MAG TPA: CBS domain-containing protein [Actinomycetales bacterium]|nr:CBS domain-containing protein [Actinomycetales bacterium]
MRISDVLRRKGDEVVTVPPDESVRTLLTKLAEHKVGAMVVSADGSTVDGIVSERDVVRHLNSDGEVMLSETVAQIMTSDVHTCTPQATVVDVMRTMTDQRVRHIPVVVDGRLAGIVSIGDVVKHRIDELTDERDHLTAYISR